MSTIIWQQGLYLNMIVIFNPQLVLYFLTARYYDTHSLKISSKGTLVFSTQDANFKTQTSGYAKASKWLLWKNKMYNLWEFYISQNVLLPFAKCYCYFFLYQLILCREFWDGPFFTIFWYAQKERLKTQFYMDVNRNL